MFDDTTPMIDRVRAILPQIKANAAKAEADRMVPAENIDLLKGTGLHRAFQPKAYGGLEMPVPDFENCIALIATACGSTAWAMSLLAEHAHQIALYSKELQDEIWGEDPDTLSSSSIAPYGQAVEVEGGVRFSGEFGWSSGCDHATWAILGFLRDDAEMGKVYSFAIVPRADYEIKDNWFTAGMRGTGSKTLVVKDAFVPNHRIESVPALMTLTSAGGALYPDSQIYQVPFIYVFASCFSAVSLGIAERMIELYTERTKGRVRAYTGAKVGQSIPACMRLAESTHQVAAGRAFLEKTWAEMRDHAERHEYPTPTQMAFWRTNQAYAVKMFVAAVDRLFEASGGSAWFDDAEAQRLFRNSHMTAAHAYTDYDICAQILGRALMGLEPDPSLF
ncbi:flavin-dependent monooxygenase [Rhodovulum sulfidophilum]|uniref:p-hydroxyphenylacetate 3-hydroxylase oxygenase component n=1 Tax=Rhodovulum sulfidophilum TaxID=35806 RepID=UPI0019242F6A|nr:flavin-dependent monooxygenase [Rhodovulum sulfidophilum]MBL3575923.1 flavin-dependent monooxygenase [Rhodovulum sulfidophilum]MCE8432804.1 flavin-dependent monooxygenase [Rhodovulum sulfidophilum]MCF4119025.1 flavin-dependent monooxygenase [Rhodovulum sulfidophilum]